VTCRCDDGTATALARVNAGGFAYPLCRNYSLHDAIASGLPAHLVAALQYESRATRLGRNVDAIAAQLAWWLPKPVEHPQPGNARREPEHLELARAASEIEAEVRARVLTMKTDGIGKLHNDAAATREAIEPDLEWKEWTAGIVDLKSRVWTYAGADDRAWARALQRDVSARRWNDSYRNWRARQAGKHQPLPDHAVSGDLLIDEHGDLVPVADDSSNTLTFRSLDGAKTRFTVTTDDAKTRFTVTTDDAGRITMEIGDLT
jgi:hypothetical protein